MSRDDDAELTRVLGTIALPVQKDHPQLPTDAEPARLRLSDPEQTRLEIARPMLASTEPETKIVDPSTLRSLNLGALPLPVPPRAASYEEITMPRPRLSVRPHDEITGPRPERRPERRTMPFVLAVFLAVVCIATGASLLRPRARGIRPMASQPGAARPVADAPAPSAPAVSPLTVAAVRPAEPLPEPSAPVDTAVIAELEKRAVDRLRDNDHPGALALYRELTRVADERPAYPVMVSLLERQLRTCQGDPRCAR